MEVNKSILFRRVLFFILLYMMWTPSAYAGFYSVHVSSYQSENQAEREAEGLRKKGYDAIVKKVHLSQSGDWYRIYVGKYSTRNKAVQLADEMKANGQIDKVFIYYLSPSFAKDKKETFSQRLTASKSIIVGNKRSKRYHLPGMPYYNKVRPQNRIYFQTEQEAIDQGYYKSGTKPPAGLNISAAKKTNDKAGEVLKKESDEKSVSRNRKAFNALLMGNVKLMPPPKKIMDSTVAPQQGFTEPDVSDINEPSSTYPLYDEAVSLMKKKEYTQALETFKKFIGREDTNKEWGQKALRHMADCYFQLGKQGSKEDLQTAVQFYKNTLESFPDPNKENALTYYRLAKTYEKLKFYPEAVRQFQNLISKYRNSSLVQEAFYRIGESYYQDGKNMEAAEALIRYQMKYRRGKEAKKAFYLTAHAFYRAKQSANAEVWFREAQKKWPDLSGLPKDLVEDLGRHKMAMRRFDEAIGAFSTYVSLYPTDTKTKDVMIQLADAYRQIGQYFQALLMYNRLIERFPETKEANKSMMSMANLGVEKPDIKFPIFMENAWFYRHPLDTYDTMIMKNPTGDIAEEAMMLKAWAWVERGDKRKAADIYLEFLSLFPESKRINEATRGLKTVSASLIDEYFAKKDYLAVAYVYFKSYVSVSIGADEYPQIYKIAMSLKELGFMDDYNSILSRYLKSRPNDSLVNKVTVDMIDGLILQNKLDEAQNMLDSIASKPSVKKSMIWVRVKKQTAEIAYSRRQYGQAVSNYKDVVRSGKPFDDPGTVYANYANALREEKEDEQSLRNYLTAVKYMSRERNEKLQEEIAYIDIGDLYLRNNNFSNSLEMYQKSLENASDNELKRWSGFLLGKAYLEMKKDEQAHSVFDQVKAQSDTDGFWSQVVDFYVSDHQWWNKYGDAIQK